jgi:hypothetical protein
MLSQTPLLRTALEQILSDRSRLIDATLNRLVDQGSCALRHKKYMILQLRKLYWMIIRIIRLRVETGGI